MYRSPFPFGTLELLSARCKLLTHLLEAIIFFIVADYSEVLTKEKVSAKLLKYPNTGSFVVVGYFSFGYHSSILKRFCTCLHLCSRTVKHLLQDQFQECDVNAFHYKETAPHSRTLHHAHCPNPSCSRAGSAESAWTPRRPERRTLAECAGVYYTRTHHRYTTHTHLIHPYTLMNLHPDITEGCKVKKKLNLL